MTLASCDTADRHQALADLAAALRRLEARRAADEIAVLASRRRGQRLAWLDHWYHPGARTPWWVFGVRLGFWLLVALGLQSATAGDGWHPDTFTAALGVAEVSWRAGAKIRAGRLRETLSAPSGTPPR